MQKQDIPTQPVISEVRKFALRALLFIALVVSLDFIAGSVLDYFYFKQKSGFQYRLNNAISKSQADIFILGSSRALHHYDPALIDSSTKLKCYNAGENGMNILVYNLVFKGIIKRKPPKYLVLDLNISEFDENKVSYERLSWLLPYYRKNPDFSEIILKRSPTEKIKLISRMYPYNSCLLQIIYGNITKENKDFNGFIPLEGQWNEPVAKLYTDVKTDWFKVKKFEEIIRLAKKNNVKLIVCVSPTLKKDSHLCKSVLIAEGICKKLNVPFFFHADYFYGKGKFFKDPDHLNGDGAEIYTSFFTKELQQEIRKL
jgi:hypothetical protein